MINEICAKKFCCEDISNIENYEAAVNDTTQTWHLHHRVEIMPYGVYSRQNLIDNGLYWNVPAAQLIFLTKSEHSRLHAMNRSDETCEKIGKSVSAALKGHEVTEEVREKMSAAKKGTNNPWFGKHLPEKICEKLSAANKGKHWFNNGIKCVFARECPQGFRPGRLKK